MTNQPVSRKLEPFTGRQHDTAEPSQAWPCFLCDRLTGHSVEDLVSTEPPVITTLKRLGLSQKDIAGAVRVRAATVSQWVSGKRTMDREVTGDLWELVCLIEEQVPQGVGLQDILRQWQPTTLVTEGGRHEQVVRSGGYPVPPDLDAAREAARGDHKAHDDISLQAALRAIAAYIREDLTPLTAAEIYDLRRVLKGAQIHLDGMCWARGGHLYPSTAGEE
jgi:hypothetical protein